MKLTQALVSLVFVLGSFSAMAYPGFSEAPVAGSALQAPTNEQSAMVVSLFSSIQKFELSINGAKVEVHVMNAGIFEADGEIPNNLLITKSSVENEPMVFLMGRIVATSVKKISANVLHFEGMGGAAYQCGIHRSFDIKIVEAKEYPYYSFRYMNVRDVRSGEACDLY